MSFDYIKIKNLKFIGLILCFNFVYMHCYENTEEDQIDYYENLITTEINKAFRYNLPTSAEAHRPNNNFRTESKFRPRLLQ